MLTDMTLGQYYPGESVLHHMDPRAKIFCMMIAVITIFSFIKQHIFVLIFNAVCDFDGSNFKSAAGNDLACGKTAVVYPCIYHAHTFLYNSGNGFNSIWLVSYNKRRIYQRYFHDVEIAFTYNFRITSYIYDKSRNSDRRYRIHTYAAATFRCTGT